MRARAIAMSASAALSCASATSMSGRRNNRSDGKPGTTPGISRESRPASERVISLGMVPTKNARALMLSNRCFSKVGMVARMEKIEAFCCSNSDKVASPAWTRLSIERSVVLRISSVSSAILSRSLIDKYST